ncbi:hypothetical protein LCGC14_0323310 [marine sediment metagenome]|uniref:Uncharacterized protein n=1 Tax=marine sediment metagenome TaxID=412755 RepID=A0A0F9U1C9_9ZZZZ
MAKHMQEELTPLNPIKIQGDTIGLDERIVNLLKFFNGTFLEFFDALVTSDGATVTMSLEKSGGGDLTTVFSDRHRNFDCTPAATIALTPGTDEAPQLNYVYILQSAPAVLVKSISDWPSAEHIRVGIFFVPTAGLVNTGAAGNNFLLINQNINEEAATADGQGHLTHIMDRLRHGGGMGGLWHTGCLGTATQDGNDLWVDIAAGTVAQVHHHDFPALDSDTAGAGDPIVVVNDPDAAYAIINSLNAITKLSTGVAIGNNKFVKFVLSAVANKTGAVSPMLLKLPGGLYNTAADAATDVEGYADFSIPDEFLIQSSTGFLIASFVCKHTATGMELQSTVDLRGQTPTSLSIGGSIAGGGNVTAAANLTDNALIRGDGGAKGIQDSGWLLDDSDNMLIPAGGSIAFTDVSTSISAVTGNLNSLVAGGNSFIWGIGFTDELILFENRLEFKQVFQDVGFGWATASELDVEIDGVPQVTFTDGTFEPVTTNDIDIGSLTVLFKDGHLAGSLFFRDAAIHISSDNDGDLDLEADVSIDFEIGGTEEMTLTSAGLDVTNLCKAETFESDVAGGTAPIVVASTTVVPNLNVDQVDGKDSTDLVLVDGSQPLTADWDAGAFSIRAGGFRVDGDGGTEAGTITFTNVEANAGTGGVPTFAAGVQIATGKEASPAGAAPTDWLKIRTPAGAKWLLLWT